MRSLRSGGQNLPGIALSGYGMGSDIEESRAAGFAEHLTKPVNVQSLQSAICRVLQQVP